MGFRSRDLSLHGLVHRRVDSPREDRDVTGEASRVWPRHLLALPNTVYVAIYVADTLFNVKTKWRIRSASDRRTTAKADIPGFEGQDTREKDLVSKTRETLTTRW